APRINNPDRAATIPVNGILSFAAVAAVARVNGARAPKIDNSPALPKPVRYHAWLIDSQPNRTSQEKTKYATAKIPNQPAARPSHSRSRSPQESRLVTPT